MQVSKCDIIDSGENNYYRIESSRDLARAVTAEKFDFCLNASGSGSVSFSYNNPAMDKQLNLENVRVIAESLAQANPTCKLVNFSSAAVYGNPEKLPVHEGSSTRPLSPYGRNKLEAEKMLKELAHQGLSCNSLRVFSAYGPGLHKQIFWDLFLKSRQSEKIELFGTGHESRDFIYICDLLHAIECVLEKAVFEGETINVASGIEVTIKEAAGLFLNCLPGTKNLFFSGQSKAGDPLNWKADITHLRSLGFQPQTPLAQGLKETAAEYLASLAQLSEG